MRTYDSAVRRWAGVGPYYAMFPTDFADRVIDRYTQPGDAVLDPFAGRGTAVFSAAHMGRRGFGIEINPVGWVYAKTKLRPATRGRVEQRLREIGELASECQAKVAHVAPFFKHAYAPRVRAFLMAAREELKWRHSRIDRTVAALLMVYLHGKRDASLSNQMRQTKSVAPDYAVRWWRERALKPPILDPVEFMLKRLEWRYAKGLPEFQDSRVYLANSASFLPVIANVVTGKGQRRASLLFTSPPYFALTNYHYDQWIRLWLLGGPAHSRRTPGNHEVRGKFESAKRYEQLLRSVFEASAQLLGRKAVVYVRTGRDAVTYSTTRRVLKEIFREKTLTSVARPYTRPTQTSLFGDPGRAEGEVDLILRPS